MSSGLTPIRDLQEEAFDQLEEGMNPSGVSKIKKIKLDWEDKEIKKYATHQQVQDMQIKKQKKLLIEQIKELQKVFSELSEESELVRLGNQSLRETGLESLSEMVKVAAQQIKEQKQRIKKQEADLVEKKQLNGLVWDILKEKEQQVNETYKLQKFQQKHITQQKRELEKGQELVENLKKGLKRQKMLQKLRLQRIESDFKVAKKMVDDMQVIFDDFKSEKNHLVTQSNKLKEKERSLNKKEQQVSERLREVRDRESTVRRLIATAKNAGIEI